jgi:cytochrome c-type biogenesis protein CcmH/NrfG
VDSLSWIERKIAQTIYANIPNTDYDTALNAFIKADQLRPNWKENHLWMAKVLIAHKNTSEAKKWIEKGLSLPSSNV